MTFLRVRLILYLLVVADVEREGDEMRRCLKFANPTEVVGFSPNARRDVEVEIVRMLPAVTPGGPRSPTTKRVGAKNAAKK